MSVKHTPQVTASEMASLWGTYIEETLATAFLRYFQAIADDPEVVPILKLSQKYAQHNIDQIAEIFTKENMPIPHGFTMKDVNPAAPRLYSDIFILRYLKNFSRVGMISYAVAKSVAGRSDVRAFYTNCLAQSSKVYDLLVDLMLAKGVFIRPPVIPKPDKVEFVKHQSFLSGLLGKHRPLTAIEISHLGINTETNLIGRTLLMGFSQVASTSQVRNYMTRGKEIASKHAQIFGSLLSQDDIPSPSEWDSTVSDSTKAPFSDKLMMFQVGALSATGIGNYGAALGASMRKDVGSTYIRLTSEVMEYAQDGANIMIEHGWMEQPPQAVDREALTHR